MDVDASTSELIEVTPNKTPRRRPPDRSDTTRETSSPVPAAVPVAPKARAPRKATAARSQRAAIEAPATTPANPETAESVYLDYRNRLVRLAQDRALTMRRLTIYRRANEELQNAFLSLERHLPPGANAPDLVFADERRSSEARVTLGWGSPGLSQILPVSSFGISAISLSFFGIAPRAGALLRVHLSSLEDQRVIDRWSIPLEQLKTGWTMLALTRTLVGPSRTLDLRLDLDGQADSAVSLHLGTVQPIETFRVRNAATNLPMVGSGVAMQIWCGEPFGAGANQPNTIAADVQRDAGGSGHFEPLAASLLEKVKRVNSDDAQFPFDPVSFVSYRTGITCHPPVAGRTTASLPLPAGCAVRAFTADVEIGNDKSSPVDFAVAIASDEERARLLFEGTAPADTEAVSAWTSVAHGTPVTLTALRRADTAPATAFVATRMSQPGNNDFAWARFRNIAIAASPE